MSHTSTSSAEDRVPVARFASVNQRRCLPRDTPSIHPRVEQANDNAADTLDPMCELADRIAYALLDDPRPFAAPNSPSPDRYIPHPIACPSITYWAPSLSLTLREPCESEERPLSRSNTSAGTISSLQSPSFHDEEFPFLSVSEDIEDIADYDLSPGFHGRLAAVVKDLDQLFVSPSLAIFDPGPQDFLDSTATGSTEISPVFVHMHMERSSPFVSLSASPSSSSSTASSDREFDSDDDLHELFASGFGRPSAADSHNLLALDEDIVSFTEVGYHILDAGPSFEPETTPRLPFGSANPHNTSSLDEIVDTWIQITPNWELELGHNEASSGSISLDDEKFPGVIELIDEGFSLISLE